MLDAKQISKSFPTADGPLDVLRDATLRLDAGESAAVVGASGCGKSTLLNILGTLESPTGGSLIIGGRSPQSMSERELAAFRNKSIGFVFQEHHLLPQCSVLENVLVPSLVESGRDATDWARHLLERVGLSARLDHRPAELSGGERQRTAIARALVNRPSVVLADEPTGNLDRRTADVISTMLLELHREENTVLVVVTHSEELAARFDQRFTIDEGVLKAAPRA